VKKFVCAGMSAALSLSLAAPALAQGLSRDHGFNDAYASRQEAATAMLDYRIPLGGGSKAAKPDYGMSLKFGPSVNGLNGRDGWKPDVKLADIRFTEAGLKRAQVANLTFAGADYRAQQERLNIVNDGRVDVQSLTLIALVAIGVGLYLYTEQDDNGS
jgi:hypothetical protein